MPLRPCPLPCSIDVISEAAEFARNVIRVAPHLDDPRFRPVLLSFARLTLLLERSYAALGDTDSLISDKTGEIRMSVDTVARLIGQQGKLAAMLGFTPSTLAR